MKLRNHKSDLTFVENEQNESLLQKAISLQQILEKNSLLNIEISLEREIRDAAHKAEDIIESRMVDRMLSNASVTEESPSLPNIESAHDIKKSRVVDLMLRSRNLIQWCKSVIFSSAEDIIESRMVDPMLSEELLMQRRECVTFSSPDLQQVMLELDSAKKQVVKFMETTSGGGMMLSSRGSNSSGGGAAASFNPKSASGSGSTVVGFDKDLMELKDRLTGMQTKLEIIPIVGMGGAGKTTLAQNLYEDPTIVSRFVARAWATVSQDYDMRTILLSLLSCIPGKEVNDGEVSVLKDRLYQSLYGRRYLIVLDDIWSTQVWDEIRMFFPDNNKGSRIVITTRETKVTKYANSQSQQHEVQLLSESASWNLLRQIVFGKDDCPFELESIGRKMASDCGGLPLAITVIGGLLSKVERSQEVWENIGGNIRAAIANSDEGEQYSNILSLSYKQLPNYLKPCFLYMGAFPEDYEIKGSRLIRLWIAEGFIKSNRDKSLEEVAEDYLKGLVERNLVMVRRSKSNRKPMTYIIHDVLSDLCIRKAYEDNFLHVMTNQHDRVRAAISKLRRASCDKSYSDGILEEMYASPKLKRVLCIRKAYEDNFLHGMTNQHDRGRAAISKLRRVSFDKSCSYGILEEMYASPELMSLARSFLCTENWLQEIVRSISSVSNLLRVLDIMHTKFKEFPEEILQLVNLRYLGVYCERLPVGISRFLNLQTLIADLSSSHVPSEIWTMSELKTSQVG